LGLKLQTVKEPSFSWRFLLPQYWLVWLGLSLLFLVTLLPLSVLRKLAKVNTFLLHKLAKKRVNIARTNIALAFPEMSKNEQAALVNKNIEVAGMALFETAMGWWWPKRRLQPLLEIEGQEHLEGILAQGKGAFTMALHNMNAEVSLRLLGLYHPCVAFYRSHNNKLMDYVQYKGRARSNKYLIDKRSSRNLIDALNQGELCIYLPDQDYGKRGSIFVPFFGVEKTATLTACMMFAKRADCIPLMLTTQYTATGYKLKFYPPMPDFAEKDEVVALTELNQQIETMVMEQPESYLWMHKRFKTRPEGEPSFYPKK
jgi:KDO2-lipid IV(A) lauroyltransferase